ncbi:hypothetical protein HRG_000602 [Hirsutella rhossiliensis]|uniref:Uncharacterized protein n=1 Tax=Hirsutella rhossiliensis TaxID=111463 RepID=A0A9P8N6Y4_9HYPO|nr:uncharacterized protein HRG_00602 [Hirsutella rhossiliensis]KAH0967960.1 hypothetical protein HRG_00602 [Hirsutella rhossiliensis]
MIRKDDRSSGRSGKTRSSKGKRPEEGLSGSRTVSRTTLGSATSTDSPVIDRTSKSLPPTPDADHAPPLDDDVDVEEEQLRQEEMDEMARDKEAFMLSVSSERGLSAQEAVPVPEQKPPPGEGETREPELRAPANRGGEAAADSHGEGEDLARRNRNSLARGETAFQAARLPSFG